MDAYFKGPHHFCFYTFIHPETFRRLHAHGRIPISLLLAILATSLRCIEPKNPLADEWAQRSRRLVMDDTFSRMSALNLQAILLLARYQWHLGAHSSASLLSAMAQRMAYDLQLNREPGGTSGPLPDLILETRRRLMWSTFVLGDLPDAGGHQPALPGVSIDPRTITIHVPCGDSRYLCAAPKSGVVSSLSCRDISPAMMPLLVIRNRVLRYSVAFHPRSEISSQLECPWHPGAQFSSFLGDLESWYSGLSAELLFSDENVSRDQSHLTSFLALHCIFHVVHTDLFGIGYFYRRRSFESKASPTPGQEPPESFLVHCDLERRRHACRILEILARTKDLLQQPPDPFVAICAGVAFRVLCLEPPRKDAADPRPSPWPNQVQINAAFDCIGISAQWSHPIRRLVWSLKRTQGLQFDKD